MIDHGCSGSPRRGGPDVSCPPHCSSPPVPPGRRDLPARGSPDGDGAGGTPARVQEFTAGGRRRSCLCVVHGRALPRASPRRRHRPAHRTRLHRRRRTDVRRIDGGPGLFSRRFRWGHGGDHRVRRPVTALVTRHPPGVAPVRTAGTISHSPHLEHWPVISRCRRSSIVRRVPPVPPSLSLAVAARAPDSSGNHDGPMTCAGLIIAAASAQAAEARRLDARSGADCFGAGTLSAVRLLGRRGRRRDRLAGR